MKNLPARAGDVGLTPGPGRPRVPWGSWACVPQPLEASGGEAVLCSGDPAQPKIEQKWVSECAEFTLKWGVSHRLRWDLLSQRKMKWSYVENFLKMGLCWKSWYSKRYFFCEEPYEEKEGLLKDWRHYFCERRILGYGRQLPRPREVKDFYRWVPGLSVSPACRVINLTVVLKRASFVVIQLVSQILSIILPRNCIGMR